MSINTANMLLLYPRLSPRQFLMLRTLKEEGYKILVIAWDRLGDSPIPDEYKNVVDRWMWIRLPAPIGDIKLITKIALFYYYLIRICSQERVPSFWLLTHIFLLPIAPLLIGKKIYDASEMYCIDMGFYFRPLKKQFNWMINLFEAFFIKQVDQIITVDSLNGWLTEKYKKYNCRVEVIWNVPSKMDDPDVNDLLEEYLNKKVVAFIGGLNANKGFEIAIESAVFVKEKHPDALFLFIGSSKRDEGSIQKLIQKNKLENNIRILNWMPYREMLTHLRYAKIGLALHQQVKIYPFVSTGNGRKFFTYMQAAIPIIGPNFGEIGRAVKIADCGLLVDTENKYEVSKAISRLLDDPDLAGKMGRNGRRAFDERFNWETEKYKFINILKQMLVL